MFWVGERNTFFNWKVYERGTFSVRKIGKELEVGQIRIKHFKKSPCQRLSGVISRYAENLSHHWADDNRVVLFRFGRKRPLVYCMIVAAIASVGAVLFTMYDPGEDKGRLVTIHVEEI